MAKETASPLNAPKHIPRNKGGPAVRAREAAGAAQAHEKGPENSFRVVDLDERGRIVLRHCCVLNCEYTEKKRDKVGRYGSEPSVTRSSKKSGNPRLPEIRKLRVSRTRNAGTPPRGDTVREEKSAASTSPSHTNGRASG